MSGDYVLLSTDDNPYNPHTDFDDWNNWDQTVGYDSLSLLARFVVSSDELSEPLQRQAIEDAIDTIVMDNFSGHHIRVTKPPD